MLFLSCPEGCCEDQFEFGYRQMEGVVAVIVLFQCLLALVFFVREGECSAGACLP